MRLAATEGRDTVWPNGAKDRLARSASEEDAQNDLARKTGSARRPESLGLCRELMAYDARR